MNRTEYQNARSLVRSNGKYALRWLEAGDAWTFNECLRIESQTDYLAERALAYSSPYCPKKVRDKLWLTAPLHLYRKAQ